MRREWIGLAALALCLLTATAQATEPLRRAIVVGANAAYGDSQPLRYAHDDARAVAELLEIAGGFRADVQLDPRPAAVLAALDRALAELGEAEAEGLIVFYFSGHADQRALYVGGAPLPIADLRRRLEDPRAKVRVGILDACQGGEWTGTKGLFPAPAFEVAPSLAMDSEGSVLLASSSGDEKAHELERLGGSLFTHHLLAGLRGAADVERDGAVTLDEAFDYARYRTIRDAGRMVEAPQHPSFRIDLSGRRSVTLTRPGDDPGAVILAAMGAPVDVLDLGTGRRVVDVPASDGPVHISLPPGRYLLRRLDGEARATHEFTVASRQPLRIAPADLEPGAPADARTKRAGDVAPGPERAGGDVGEANRVRPLSLPAGDVRLDVVVGGGLRNGLSAQANPADPLGVSLGLGITDHLDYSFPLVLGLRLPIGDRWSVLAWGGLTGMGHGVRQRRQSGRVVEESWLFDGAAGVQGQLALGPRSAVELGVDMRFADGRATQDDGLPRAAVLPTGVYAYGATLTVSHVVGERLTFAAGVTVAGGWPLPGETNALVLDEPAEKHVLLGGVAHHGVRPRPLIELKILDWLSLTGHAVLAVKDLDLVRYGGGVAIDW